MSSTLTDRIRGVATSVAIKVPVRCCTTENITLSGLQTIDGVALSAGDRVLVRNQTDAVTNGIWTASIGAWARAIDFNGTYDAVLGTEVYVQSGTVNGDLRFALTTSAPVIGSSSLTFTAISGTVTLLAEEARDAAIAAAADADAAATAAGLAAGTAETAAGDAQGFAEAAEALVGSFNPAAATEATASAAIAVEAAGQADTARDEAVAARDVAVGVADNLPDWQGAWETGVAYETGDLIQTAGSSYICTVAHTSGTFATDLGAGRWELFAAKGAAGAGTGDMLGANNLSDVEDAAAARGNLGLADMATQAPGAVEITGGSIAGIDDLAIADGGTGASTADAALNNLGGTGAGKALFTAADVDAQMEALGAAPLDSPAFTGNPTAPTQTAGNNSTRIATTAFVASAVDGLLEGFAAGDEGQPKIRPRALSDTIYLGRLATSGTSWQAMTGLDDIKKVRIDLWYDSAGLIYLGLSSDGGSTWSSDVNIGLTNADFSLLVADLETGQLGSAGKVSVSTTVSGGPFNALRIRNNTTGSFAAIVTALTGRA